VIPGPDEILERLREVGPQSTRELINHFREDTDELAELRRRVELECARMARGRQGPVRLTRIPEPTGKNSMWMPAETESEEENDGSGGD
jgi:hypothetical protein